MQLYDFNDSQGIFSESELLSFANKTLSAEIGRSYFVKGKNNLSCTMINNTAGSFSKGLGHCGSLSRSFCQFLEASRK
jgi:hypothetical protein